MKLPVIRHVAKKPSCLKEVYTDRIDDQMNDFFYRSSYIFIRRAFYSMIMIFYILVYFFLLKIKFYTIFSFIRKFSLDYT